MSAPTAEAAGLTVERREEIAAKWLQQCGPCDAGLPMECSHPSEDYRPVMAALLDALAAAEAERDQLFRWKREATPLFDGLQDLGRALQLPLGVLITGPVATEAAQTLMAELDEARAAAERVKWVTEVHLTRRGLWDKEVGLDIRAAWAAGDDLARAALDTATSEGA